MKMIGRRRRKKMGYRLEISKVEYASCGGKLFGYVDNEKNLKSYQYLLENGHINGDECWDYGCNPQILLNAKEFKEFIKLYSEDWKDKYGIEYHSDDSDLIDSNSDKLLEWY